MSWASIAKTVKQSKNTPRLLIKYNITESIKKQRKSINKDEEKEILPDPSDDFIMSNGYISDIFPPTDWNGGWLDFEKYYKLKTHKESLPISIQRIIEWTQQWIGYGKLINLNYNEIEKDLKYQYDKYKGDKMKLKKIYFNFNPTHILDWNYSYKTSHDYDETNFMYYGPREPGYHGSTNYTMIHFLVNMMSEAYLIHDDPVLILLKLLIKNKIIDAEDILHTATYGYSVYDAIIHKAVDSMDGGDVKRNLGHFVDLIIYCMEQKKINQQPSILQLDIRKIGDDEESEKKILIHPSMFSIRLNALYNNDRYNVIYNNDEIIENLLFRGMLAFQFYDETNKSEGPWRGYRMDIKEPIILKPFENENKTQEFMNRLFDEFNDCEDQMSLMSPLVLLPHLNRAKCMMVCILSKCIIDNDYIESDTLSVEIANIVTFYVFVNYDAFYTEQIQNNLNGQTMLFLNHLRYFGADKQFIKDFKEKYNNKELINYMVNNYLCLLSCIVARCKVIDGDIICSLIETYNNNNDSNHKFPLKPDGIYYILGKKSRCFWNKEYHESFMNLLKYIKQSYKETFDINFKYQYEEDTITLMLDILQNGYPEDIAMNAIKFILTEYKDEYDVNNPCLLYLSVKFKKLQLFKYLIANYDLYSLNKICNTVKNVISDAMIAKTDGLFDWHWNKWQDGDDKECKVFLNDIKEICSISKCENNQDIEFLDKYIKQCLAMLSK